MTKKLLLLILIFLPIFLIINIYFLDKHYFLCPIEYQKDIIVRSDDLGEGNFDARRSAGRRTHKGIDLLADIGCPVMSVRSGVVIAATSSNGMGNYVIVKHLGDFKTVYGHLSEIYVCENQIVRQGQIIGSVGKTGNANHRSILPHLHFEARRNGVALDPLEYLQ